ncbi:hypothetical protein L218DRAFT_900239, partial [Marasmius fiardii PR-910]
MPDDWGHDSPPDASSAVVIVADSITIDAPVEKVWNALLDFPSYEEWWSELLNRRKQTIVEPSSRKPLDDQTPKVGAQMLLKPVHIPATFDPSSLWPWQFSSAYVKITYIDNENHRVAWRTTGLPTFLLDAERWQTIRRRDDGKTEYETYEVFRGLAAYLMRLFVVANLKKAVRSMAQELKKKAE